MPPWRFPNAVAYSLGITGYGLGIKGGNSDHGRRAGLQPEGLEPEAQSQKPGPDRKRYGAAGEAGGAAELARPAFPASRMSCFFILL
jgi:hypothetical protein